MSTQHTPRDPVRDIRAWSENLARRWPRASITLNEASDAVARLIAERDALAAALRDVLSNYNAHPPGCGCYVCRARAALAKLDR